MKVIQWYPGHMAKAVRMMGENLKLCDAVVYVLDARAPAASYNPLLAELAGGRPVLYLLNKGDLADGAAEGLVSLMKRSGRSALKISANVPACRRVLQEAMGQLVKEKAQRYAARSTTRALRFLVAGIPNTGKSTVINLLAGERKAQTGDKVGVTRAKQWVKCGSFELMDTPGVMPPACENQIFARRLAYLGSINDEILEQDEIAIALLEELAEKYPNALSERYGIGAGLAPEEALRLICARRGFMEKGGEYDYVRGERALLDDFRKGRLGKLCLDSPEDLRAAGLI